MTANGKAGADAPATRHAEVGGIQFDVNGAAISSWAFFKGLRRLGDESVDNIEKLELSFSLIEMATGITEDEIVEAAGGEDAAASDVIALAAAIVKELTPKN